MKRYAVVNTEDQSGDIVGRIASLHNSQETARIFARRLEKGSRFWPPVPHVGIFPLKEDAPAFGLIHTSDLSEEIIEKTM